MNCPGCGAEMDPGTVGFERSAIAAWMVARSGYLGDGPPTPLDSLCFSPGGTGEVVARLDPLGEAFRCPECDVLVLRVSGDDDTRRLMVARWKALRRPPTSEPGR